MPFSENRSGGLVYMTSAVIAARHAFTTRLGGVSTGVWESLNLGENRGDAPENITENYRRLCAALGLSGNKLVFSKQVHGVSVRRATRADLRAPFDPLGYEADGLVTDEPGLPLIVFTADCVPVLLCDAENGVAAAVHCGWRSSVGDILGAAVSEMLALGAGAESLCAAIGPAIGACCFETGPDVPEAVLRWLGDGGRAFFREKPGAPGKFLVDLRAANRRRLLTLGLRPENIDVSGECTVCKSGKYWSHRATHGSRGSQAAVIVLPERGQK